MNDYLDAMIEAHDAALDAWDLHKGQDLDASVKMMERAAMRAVLEVVRAKDSTGSFTQSEPAAHTHSIVLHPVNAIWATKDSAIDFERCFNERRTAAMRHVPGEEKETQAESVGYDIGRAVADACMPAFREVDKRERLWEAVKLANGGSY